MKPFSFPLFQLPKASLLLIPFILGGCATSKVNLYSSPAKAKVFAKSLADGREKLVGETPLVIQADTLVSSQNGTGPVVLEFRKDGYAPREVVLTEVNVADVMISADLVPENGLADQQTINWVVETMFEAQRLVRIKRYDEALRQLSDVQRIAPQIAAVYEVKGGIYYLVRRYRDALDNYMQSVKYNPKNPETLRMVSILKNLVSGEDPTSSDGSRQPAGDNR